MIKGFLYYAIQDLKKDHIQIFLKKVLSKTYQIEILPNFPIEYQALRLIILNNNNNLIQKIIIVFSIFYKEDFIINQIILINIKLFRKYLSLNKIEFKNIMSQIIYIFQILADFLK